MHFLYGMYLLKLCFKRNIYIFYKFLQVATIYILLAYTKISKYISMCKIYLYMTKVYEWFEGVFMFSAFQNLYLLVLENLLDWLRQILKIILYLK